MILVTPPGKEPKARKVLAEDEGSCNWSLKNKQLETNYRNKGYSSFADFLYFMYTSVSLYSPFSFSLSCFLYFILFYAQAIRG